MINELSPIQTNLLYFHELDKWCKLGAVQLRTVFSPQSICIVMAHACVPVEILEKCFTKIIADLQRCTKEEIADILGEVSLGQRSVDVFA